MDMTYYKKYEPIFGSWRIVREIGEGSFGKVFEIEREDFGRTYKAALKTITIPQNPSEVKTLLADGYDEGSVTDYYRSFVEEMVDEFGIMSQLKGHPNIVGYEDHLVAKHEDGLGWDILIRMELLTPFLDYSRGHTISTSDAVQLGIDICRALEACRENDIIHRDIKPENIFISKFGGYKLGDFGIARTVEKTTGGLSKKGTYSYMAPEVYKGEAYGASVDIYSLGVVLYRLLNNNCLPFVEQGKAGLSYSAREKALMRRMSGEAIPAPANAGEQLAEIVLKACAYDPRDRYQSPTEMREALEKALNGQSGSYPLSHVDEEKTVVLAAEPEEYPEEDRDKTVGVFDTPKVKGKAEEKTEVMSEPEPKTETEPARKPEPKKVDAKTEAEQPKAKRKTGGFIAAIVAVLVLAVAAIVILPGMNRTEPPTRSIIPPVTNEPASPLPDKESSFIGISLPTKDLWRWNEDGTNLREQLEKIGYRVDLQYGANDVLTQVSQIENMIANGCKVLVIAAIEGDSLGTVLAQAKEKNIPVIAYDRLIMYSDAVSYYATFDNWLVGVKQGEFIDEKLGLKDAGDKTFNIEFITGDPGDNNINFFFDGAMSVLQPYVDAGTLVCPSGQVATLKDDGSYDKAIVATAGWDTAAAQSRFENILASFYADGTQLDAVLASNDSTACGVENALAASYTNDVYPVITGQDCDIAIMKNLIEGKQSMSVFKDTRTLAAKVVEMVDALMKGAEPPINDTETYDNGTGIIPSFLCEPVACTVDNYTELLIDSGYYTMDQIG